VAEFDRLAGRDLEPLALLGRRGLVVSRDEPRHDLRLGRAGEPMVSAPFLQGEGGAAARQDLGAERLHQRQRLDARNERVGPWSRRLRTRGGQRNQDAKHQRAQRAAKPLIHHASFDSRFARLRMRPIFSWHKETPSS
jgi:hypothetical protein